MFFSSSRPPGPLIARPRRLLAHGAALVLWSSWLLRPAPAAAQAAGLPAGTPGLLATYYRGYFNDSLRFFTTTPPAIVNRAVEQLNFAEAETDNFGVGSVGTYNTPGNPDEFSGRFQGQLYVLTPGQYTFYLGSDDAAYLWLDGGSQPVALNQGDRFGYRETTGTLTLAAGPHPLRVAYGEHGGSQGLVLSYSGPDLPRQLVPNGVLYTQATAAFAPTLSQFGATAGPQQVSVQWTTAAEENGVAFVVQKSTDGVAFQTLTRVPSANPAALPHAYQALDPQPAPGLNYYRLQQLRGDRDPVYSPIQTVAFAPQPLAIGVYPVPNDGTFWLALPPGLTGTAQLELFDMSGRRLYHQPLLPGGTPARIQPALATGVYLLQLDTEQGRFRQKISLDY